jgi:hypothetical protein
MPTTTSVSQTIPAQKDRDIVNDLAIQKFWAEVRTKSNDSGTQMFARFVTKTGLKIDVVLACEKNDGKSDDNDKAALDSGLDHIVYFGALQEKKCLGQLGVYYSKIIDKIREKTIETDINHRRIWIATGLINALIKFCDLNEKTFTPSGNYTQLGANLVNAQPNMNVLIDQSYNHKRNYSRRTVALLFGLSGNRCAFPGCNNKVIENETQFDDAQVVAQIAHIHDCTSGKQRSFVFGIPSRNFINRYENLILLCAHHHTMVDSNCSTRFEQRYPFTPLPLTV